MNRLILFSILIVICASCKKENLPEDQEGEVQFFFKGQVGQDILNWEAGKNGLYMNTTLEGNGNLAEMNGIFSQEDTSITDSFLSISFYMDQSLTTGLFDYFSISDFNNFSTDSAASFEVSFSPYGTDIFGFPDFYIFDFGDGTSIMDSLNVPVLHTYTQSGSYDVRYQMFYGNQMDSVVNTIDLVPNKTCYPQLFLIDSSSHPFYYLGVTNGLTNFSIENTTTNLSYSGTFISLDSSEFAPGINSFVLTANDPLCSGSFRLNIRNDYAPSPTFSYTATSNSTADSRNGTVRVTYHKDGNTYTSDGKNKNKLLSILSSVEYDRNLYGQLTYRLEGSIEGYLYNVNNASDSIFIQSDQLNFAVGVPD